jgi:ribosomal protein S27E
MEPLDGNAVGGLLFQVFGKEMTNVAQTCASCGNTAVIAETVVYLRAPGTLIRCPSCTALLMAITQIRGVICIDTSGISDLAAGEATGTSGFRDAEITNL